MTLHATDHAGLEIVPFAVLLAVARRGPGGPGRLLCGRRGRDPAEVRRLNDLGLQSWGAAADEPHWIRIRPTSITGRTPGTAFGG
jgi:hypothetical protein